MGVSFESFTEGRAKLKQLLDAAERGLPATLRRDAARVAIVDAERYVSFLRQAVPERAEVVVEKGGWSVFVPGLPVAADGATFDEAVDEMVGALREYAEDWEARLHAAPNHRDRWALVQLIALSDEAALRSWLVSDEQ
jgi:predicted RNase H-like HicB family nuclease